MKLTREFVRNLSSRVKQKLPFIQVVIGPRQVGKTTGVRQVYEQFPGPKHMVSADDPSPKSAQWLQIAWEEALRLGPGTLLVIDEIQKVSGWAETIKMLYEPIRGENFLHVILLGSASLSIQQGLSAALAGRFELLKVSHWTFFEHSQMQSWNLDQFLSFGGYPAAALLASDEQRWGDFIRDSIIEPVLGRDLSGLVQIAKPALFRQTFERAMQYPAQTISYNKMLGQLQEGGNTSTIRHYLELLEGAFLIRLLPRFAGGSLQRRSSSPKIVPLAPALSQAYRPRHSLSSDATWQGRILEAAVGAHLCQLPGRLSYWNEGDYEVDYVWEFENRVLGLEIKSARQRRPKSLERFLSKFPKAQGRILDREQIGQILLGKGFDMYL